ncbi:MAG: S8 family serine peptidase [Ilumatobacter sp.]|uniref:S8 family serine peptidase n=1 Tax=Ilumatobacter sp. TaxID=1967498 RepID=UPI00262D116F|nr:S8 family serine peptidase [Ilumatobacter sp.]MDJ0769139.1 S8 family serine peptidase [Ilumatobacter sp.]
MQQPLVRHRRRLTAAATIVAAAVALTVTGSTGAGSGAAAEAGVAVPAADTIAPASSALTLSMEVKPGQPVPLALITEKAAAGLYAGGHRGQGIDVAIIDSGVAPVVGLDQPGKMLHGPDLSNEGGFQNVANLDTYGHGTHLAGIIAGDDGGEVVGIAPESRLVSLKVADATGAVDIAQVIAAIEWVVEHKNDNGLNIRVLNLSLGVDGVATNLGDPLSIAVERAWDAGIVVVAAAGNRGNGAPGIDSPAISPYVIAVGGTESYDSDGYSDKVAPWSSRGNAYRAPDVVAPGRSIKSFRVPGSMLDQQHPNAKVGDKHFRGSGTSQPRSR